VVFQVSVSLLLQTTGRKREKKKRNWADKNEPDGCQESRLHAKQIQKNHK
jgi:hypothetical protein